MSPGVMIGMQFSFGHGLGAVHEVPQRTKVNSEQYFTLLSERYLPELRAWCADDTDTHWQQDRAPSHRSKKTMNCLKGPDWRKVEQVSWPAASPDLNVLDWTVCASFAQLRTQEDAADEFGFGEGATGRHGFTK